MSIENGNKGKGSTRQVSGAPKDLADIRLPKSVAPEVPTVSQTMNDPKYAELRTRFQKHKIPLELMDYALGFEALPKRDAKGQFPSRDQGRIAALLDQHGERIMNERRLAYKAHMKRMETDPAFAAEWEKSGAVWQALGKEGAVVMLPDAAEESRTTKDLSPMPDEIRERVKRHPAAVNYALTMFMRQMRDWPFEDETTRKFAQHFAESVEEKAFRQNRENRERSMYENAYWALLDLKVGEEVTDTKRSRSYPEIHIRADEVAKHISDFIESEKIRRDVLPTLTGGELEKAKAELAARPTNIVRAVGDRLFVPSRYLPIDDASIAAEIEKKEQERNGTDESMRLPGDLRFLSRLLGKLHGTVSQEAANASRDIDVLREYVADGNEWSESAQTGFDMINKMISTNLQAVEKMKDTLRAARNSDELTPKYAPVFETHTANSNRVERELRTAQAGLISIWNKYNGDTTLHDRIASLEEESEADLAALNMLYAKLTAGTDVDKAIRALGDYLGKPPHLKS